MNQTNDSHKNSNPAFLEEKLDELEDLIEEKKSSIKVDGATGIPILDEVVDLDDFALDEEPATAIPEPDYDQDLSEILKSMEGRIADELDNLVDVLKVSIKDSVMSELKHQLNLEQETGDPDTEDDETGSYPNRKD